MKQNWMNDFHYMGDCPLCGRLERGEEMPYVKQELRPNLDDVVEAMVDACVCANGDLNYILYKFCKTELSPSYVTYRNYCAELRACATEIERKLLAPYEDQKLLENGDVL